MKFALKVKLSTEFVISTSLNDPDLGAIRLALLDMLSDDDRMIENFDLTFTLMTNESNKLPNGWDENCIPYNSSNMEETITEILNKT